MNDSLRLIIFAKAPIAGVAKTRLIPALGADGAAQLAERMLQHTLRECVQARLGAIELCVTPGPESEYWRRFELPAAVYLSDQGVGDLGARLWRASARAQNAGESVLLLGTDCPQLYAARLSAAVSALQKADAVIHPAHDGGYVLLGLNRVDRSLFENITWGTELVARQTRERLAQCAMNCVWLETLADIDEPGDLHLLPEDWGDIFQERPKRAPADGAENLKC